MSGNTRGAGVVTRNAPAGTAAPISTPLVVTGYESGDDWSEDEPDSPFDPQAAKRLLTKHMQRSARRSSGKRPASQAATRSQYSPDPAHPDPSPPPLPADVPASTSDKDWPQELSPVRPTAVTRAHCWATYVPMRKHQALALLAAAASLQPGAHARASHLVTQIDNYAPYMAVVGMNVLKNAWRSPRPPQLTASLDEWVHYYTECPNLIPPPLSSPQNAPNAIPSRDLINGHLIFMRANPPPLPGSRNPT
ncbi:hypothetical protein K466DRAFT_607936, partial [Polyporus arcularius HHB13444]